MLLLALDGLVALLLSRSAEVKENCAASALRGSDHQAPAPTPTGKIFLTEPWSVDCALPRFTSSRASHVQEDSNS